MTAFVNTHALETQVVSSASLGPLGMIVHPNAHAGAYAGTVYKEKKEVARFLLHVDEQPGKTQVDIDLAKLVPKPGEAKVRRKKYRVSKGGFSVFYVSQGAGGYQIALERLPDEGKGKVRKEVWESAKLSENDMFAATLIRPGIWIAHDRSSSGTADITVTYPEVGKTSYAPKDSAMMIKVTQKGMDPRKAKIDPGEGVVFVVETEVASISVQLKKPDKGPKPPKGEAKPKGRRKVRWSNPRQMDG